MGRGNLKEYQYNVRIALFETRMNGITQSQKDLLSNCGGAKWSLLKHG